MDAEERALLAAIIAQPDDDTVRLVYADWLQEHDQAERAEYIRLSIQLANLRYGESDYDARYWELRAQRDPLVTRYYKQWQQEFAAKLPSKGKVSFLFGRGLVEHVSCSVTYFLKNAKLLFQNAPIRWFSPQSLSLVTVSNLTASPWYRRLRGLRIIDREDALILVQSPLPNIRCFDFSQSFIYNGSTNSNNKWESVAVRLATHSNLRPIPQINIDGVKQIDFESCGIGDAGGQALADSTCLEPDILNLIGNGLNKQVCRALRKRYGPRVWLELDDRNGFPHG